jgi:hypothetical protein
VDGIIAGTASQFNPVPCPLSTVIIGFDPVTVDAVAARVMGFDHRALKSVARAAVRRDLSLGACHPVAVKVSVSGGEGLSGLYRQPLTPETQVYNWQGHIESPDFDPPQIKAWGTAGGVLRVAVADPAGVAWVRLAYQVKGETRLKVLALAEGAPTSGVWAAPFPVGAAVKSGILSASDELFNEGTRTII